LAAPTDKIFLKWQGALVGMNDRRNRIIRHGQHRGGNAQAFGRRCGEVSQRNAGMELMGPLNVHREVAVSEPEPYLAADGVEALHEMPGFVGPAPPAFGIA